MRSGSVLRVYARGSCPRSEEESRTHSDRVRWILGVYWEGEKRNRRRFTQHHSHGALRYRSVDRGGCGRCRRRPKGNPPPLMFRQTPPRHLCLTTITHALCGVRVCRWLAGFNYDDQVTSGNPRKPSLPPGLKSTLKKRWAFRLYRPILIGWTM